MVLRVERGPQHPVQYDSYGVDDDNVDDDDDVMTMRVLLMMIMILRVKRGPQHPVMKNKT